MSVHLICDTDEINKTEVQKPQRYLPSDRSEHQIHLAHKSGGGHDNDPEQQRVSWTDEQLESLL
jgi:hypothetical protein